MPRQVDTERDRMTEYVERQYAGPTKSSPAGHARCALDRSACEAVALFPALLLAVLIELEARLTSLMI